MINNLTASKIAFGTNENERKIFSKFLKNDSQATLQKTETKAVEQPVSKPDNEVVQTPSLKEKVGNVRKFWLNLIKGFNNTTGMAAGTVKGVVSGLATTLAVGFVGRNFREGKGKIIDTMGSMLKNVGSIIKTTFTNVIPAIWNKSLKENTESFLSSGDKFYKYCAEGAAKNKNTLGIVATVAGLGVLGFNLVKAKLNANHKNAEVDHYTNNGHVKY